tara:strand:+ start:20871 stop:21239 length:369 start_codon:yes stop_codon:yes gene_type:complete
MISNIPHLPSEIVDIIADFHDYEKYCKPQHYELLKGVINNIGDMACMLPRITPHLAWSYWGPGQVHMCNENEDGYLDTWLDLWGNDYMFNLPYQNIDNDYNYDNEENNFGLDYDDTHYQYYD